jgi:hypothetical protein
MLLDKHRIHTQVLLKPEWLEEGIALGNVIQGQYWTSLGKLSLGGMELTLLDP